ncbi:MAG TPA: response regulator [Treponemataceae bacterium]|nr:response regulator [Treponemataceae bacterium]
MSSYILFVDDEEKILVSLERELEEWLEERGLQFRSAGSVDEALVILANDPDGCRAVVSDLKMPRRKGSELLLETSRAWPDIASILLTGFSDMDEIKDCIKAGIVSFMQKPWNRDILKAELERVTALTKLRRENREYTARLERDFEWTRKLHHAMLLGTEVAGERGLLDIASSPARGTLDCGGDLVVTFEAKDGSLYVCFGSLAVTGVEGTYYGARIREMLLLAGKELESNAGPAEYLGLINAALCGDFPDLTENSLSLSAFRFGRGDEFFSCAHAGGEHFALTDSGRLAVHALPSPVLGIKDNLFYPAKNYAFRDTTALILFSRPLKGSATEERLAAALEKFAAADAKHAQEAATARAILDSIAGELSLPFDSTIALYRNNR